MKEFALNLPLNNLSFGQTSIALLREFEKLGYTPALFPIGNTDISAQPKDDEFINWINQCLVKGQLSHSRDIPAIKLWHLQGSLESVSRDQTLITFTETDSLTELELNAAKNQKNVVVTSKFTKEVFENHGAKNVHYVPLGFDKTNFKVIPKKAEDKITFGLTGKLEMRKGHIPIIQSWLNKYGNNRNYFLNCAIFNPFLKPEEWQAFVNSVMQGGKIWNVQLLPFLPENAQYNDYLNRNDIIIGMSGGEGFGLPEFTSIALGKHAVMLNAHSYQGFATKSNSVLVEPNGKVPANDGRWFVPGNAINQGNFFSWDVNAFIAGCEEAIQRFRANPVNTAGLKLQEEFTYEKTAKALIDLV